MRFLKLLFIIIVVVGGLGYTAYHFGTSFIATKATEVLAEQLDDEQTLENIRVAVNNHSQIKQFIEEGATVNENDLPFHTKEEAVETVVKKLGVKKLNDMKNKYESGMTINEIQQLVEDIETKLTDEEIMALKSIAYKELYR